MRARRGVYTAERAGAGRMRQSRGLTSLSEHPAEVRSSMLPETAFIRDVGPAALPSASIAPAREA